MTHATLDAGGLPGLKLLVTGDLHIGRRSSRIPVQLDGPRFTASDGWNRVVDLAIERQVDLLLLTGDIADEENRFYEAIGPLERGISRLRDSGIRTIAVAGNHDYEVLARLSRSLDGEWFQLLGADGQWERAIVDAGGQPALAVDGWSFTTRHVETSPLPAYTLETERDIPTLAMVHGDLYDQSSRYAPLQRNEMLLRPVAGWLLGHIHAPELIQNEGSPFILYPGSPQALDPREKGVHGPWLIELDPGQPPTCRHVPLSSIRYEDVRTTLQGATERAEIDSAVMSTVRTVLDDAVEFSGQELTHLSLRVIIDGNASPELMATLPTIINELKDEENDLGSSQCSVTVHDALVTVRPSVDIAALAKERNAAADVARLILALDADETLPGAIQDVVDASLTALSGVFDHADFGAVREDGPPTEADARSLLRQQANNLLAELVAGENTI